MKFSFLNLSDALCLHMLCVRRYITNSIVRNGSKVVLNEPR